MQQQIKANLRKLENGGHIIFVSERKEYIRSIDIEVLESSRAMEARLDHAFTAQTRVSAANSGRHFWRSHTNSNCQTHYAEPIHLPEGGHIPTEISIFHHEKPECSH